LAQQAGRGPRSAPFSQSEYEKLAEFRYQLARFLRRRKDAARAEGLQAQQYELLLALAGMPEEKPPAIKEVAAQLQLEHHTVVELADRLQKQGFVTRANSPEDGRAVLLELTRAGRKVLDRIVRYSFTQLREEGPALIRSLRRILQS
jgi:DNA-binding MarR family transcriptional regulator